MTAHRPDMCRCAECVHRRIKEFRGNGVLAPIPRCVHGEPWMFCPHDCRRAVTNPEESKMETKMTESNSPPIAVAVTTGSTPAPPEHIMQFFAFKHLPDALQAISQPFYEMAHRLVDTVPRNPERTVALRKLLEAKDAAVRASLAKDGR